MTNLENNIHCAWANRINEGSCSACQCRENERVLLIQLKTISFRLCSDCLMKLYKDFKTQLRINS